MQKIRCFLVSMQFFNKVAALVSFKGFMQKKPLQFWQVARNKVDCRRLN